MDQNLKIFFKLGGVLFLGLFIAFVAARITPGVKYELGRIKWPHGFTPAVQTAKADVGEVDEEDPTRISGFSSISTFVADGTDVEADDSAWIIPAITGPMTAQEYMAVDLRSGAILEDKDIDRVVPIASLTKLVTAEVARRLMPADKEITITDAILAAYGANGHLRTGETISASELLYPLFLVSSNDAAEALAQGYEASPQTSRKDFIRAMNDWVRSIGAYHTDFYDPSGLSPYTVSTARDQVTIMEWILKNDPALIAITQQRSATVRLHTWTNSTHFLNLSNYLGGKDGYIPEAGQTANFLFSADANTAASSSPARYAIVVLGSQNRDSDVMTILKKVEGK
jgi:D-alanyl-D-alanine carboxypeptidase